MSQESSAVDQAVSRALRDNLGSLQRAAEELTQALNDVVAACSSNRPANALPPMLRAETSAASLAAALDVLSRFVTSAMKPAQLLAAGEAVTHAVSVPAPEPARAPAAPPPYVPVPMAQAAPPSLPPPPVVPPPPEPEMHAQAPAAQLEDTVLEAPPVAVAPPPAPEAAAPVAAGPFDIKSLSQEEQDLHRRANRVAKVSMQDIKMLMPEAVRLGREHKDLCKRLRADMDKAKKEYDRRFKSIQSHPVDYFYDWAVQILADGDAAALGDYPYSSPTVPR